MSVNAPFFGLTPFEHNKRLKQKRAEISSRTRTNDRVAFYRSRAGGNLNAAAARQQNALDKLKELHELNSADLRTDAEKAKAAQAQSQAQQQEMMQQAKNMMEAMASPQEDEGIQVDGISSAFAQPEPAEKEFQDQTAVEVDIDTIDDLHDLSMSVLRPEIIAKFIGPSGHDSNAGEGIGSSKFKDLLEANILRDQLSDDVYKKLYEHFSENEANILDKASERVDVVYQKTQEEIDTLSDYRAMINEALSALDLQECGKEVGTLMLETLASQLQNEDLPIEKIPDIVEDLVVDSLNITHSPDRYFSNTKIYFSLLAAIYESLTGYGSHMGNRNQPGKPYSIKLNKRSKYTTAIIAALQKSQINSRSRTVVNNGYNAVVREFGTSNAASEIQQLLCCLSNEMIISGGINRMAGTELGNKYGVTTSNPLLLPFGIDMGILFDNTFVSIPEVNPKKGTLSDFITVEDTNSSKVVLPFELNDVDIKNQKYLAGSKYMIEGPARRIDKEFTDPLGEFNKNFAGEIKSATSYFNELAGLNEDTLLSPQALFVRILEDIYTVCLEASKPVEQTDRNIIKSASKISMCTRTNNFRPVGSGFNRIPRHNMSAADILLLLSNVNNESDQPEYRASLDQKIINEINNIIKDDFGSKNKLDQVVTERWNKKLSRARDTSSKDVIPMGTFSLSKIIIDSDGEADSLHRMIITTTDEIMSESDRFASRKGSKASYKNDQGFTALSNLDYSCVFSIVYYLYHWLIKDLYHWRGVSLRSSGTYNRSIQIYREKNKVVAEALSAILGTYKEGGDFSDLFDDEQNSLAVEGLTSTKRIGRTLTMSKLIDILDGLKRHRTLLKANISALAAVSKNIEQKSSSLTAFQKEARDILTDKVRLANVKNKSLAAFASLAKQPIGKEALRGLTSMQANNTLVAMKRMSPFAELEKRQRRFVMTPGMVEALRVFNDSKELKGTEGIVCVGLPNGMIDNLRMSKTTTKIRQNESNDLGKMKIRLSRDSELYGSLEFKDFEFMFDSSLYLMPDSYDAVTSVEIEEDNESRKKSPDPVRDMIDKTMFYRLESGKLIEQKTGSELIEIGNQQTYSILKNHVISDLARISIDVAMGIDINEFDLKKYEDLNSSHISSEGLDLITSITKSKGLKLLRAKAPSIKNVMTDIEIDDQTNFFELKTGNTGQNALRSLSDYDISDIKRTGQSCLFTSELDRHRIIGTSMFDRTFYVMFNSRMFGLDYRQGDIQERRRFTYGRMSSRRFDLSGYVCDIRVT